MTDDYTKPAYCQACGIAFSWTASALKAADELAVRLNMEVKDKNRAAGSD
jgi:hypothetical protein